MLHPSVQLYRNAYSGLSRQIWWLSLVMFINRSGTMVIPFLTVYLIDKGFSLSQAGFVMGAFGAGSIVGGYLGGRLTDSFGHFYIQVISLLLNGVMLILLGQMHTLLQITICIFIVSSFGEAFRPANSAAIAAYSDDTNRTRSYSLNRLAVNLGWGIGPAVGGLLANKSFALLFWADGLTCILAAIVLYLIFISYRSIQAGDHRDNAPVRIRSAYQDQPFLMGMVSIFLVGICFFQMFSILPVYYKDQLGFSKALTGCILAMNGLIIAVMEMVLVYKLEKKRHPVFYMAWGSFLIGASFVLLNLAPLLVVAVFSMVMITLGEMLLFPFMNQFWVNRSSDQNRGQYAAVYTMSFSLAIMLAPTFAAQAAHAWGFPILWILDLIICTVAAIGFLMLKKWNHYE